MTMLTTEINIAY